MTTKEQIIQELDQVSESVLRKVLEFVQSLKTEEQQEKEEKAWQVYLHSEREREKVYHHLANS